MSGASLRDAFERDGYVLAPGLFAGPELAALEADFDRIVGQLVASGEEVDATWPGPETGRLVRPGDRVLHTHDVQKYSARWLRAFLREPFLDAAEALLGPDIVLHHSKLFFKPPRSGSAFPAHQDWSYFPTLKDTMLAAVVHVSDADDASGCLRVHAGSHRLGRLADSHGQAPCPGLKDHPLESATPVPARAGDVLFFHYLTVHGSLPNRSERPRKTVLVQLHAGADRPESDDGHPNERLVLRGWNAHATRSRAGRVEG